MKLLLCVLVTWTFGSALADEKPKVDRPHLLEEAKRSAFFLEKKIDRISEADAIELSNLYNQVFDVLKGGRLDVACLESTQNPGKFCFKSISSNSNLCLNTLFGSREACQKSLQVVRKDKACFESKDSVGKGMIGALIEESNRVGNYYQNLDACIEAMSVARREFVCQESKDKVGKAFVANLDSQDASRTGNYYSNPANCLNAMKAAKRNYVCYESNNDRYAGKWLIGNMEKDGDMEGPYFSNFDECKEALKRKALPIEESVPN